MKPRSKAQISALLWRTLVEDYRPLTRKSFICTNCQNALRYPRPIQPFALVSSASNSRTFSTTSPFLKKKDKGRQMATSKSNDSKTHGSTPIPGNKAEASRDAEVDPYDYTELEARIAKSLERLKNALGKTHNAGRVSVEMIEGLNVELKDGGVSGKEGGKHGIKLAEIATVVPKGGRMVQIYAQEEGHIKPLTAAILSSPHSLTLSPDTISSNPNPLVLNIPIPPATAETRAQAATEAKKSLERSMQDIRMARGDEQKRFRKMELGKLVIKDELVKAHKGMEEVVKKGEAEAKRMQEGAIKALER